MVEFIYGLSLYVIAAGLTLGGSAMAFVVVASDCQNADPMALADEYKEKSQSPLGSNIRWYFAIGLGGALAGMGI